MLMIIIPGHSQLSIHARDCLLKVSQEAVDLAQLAVGRALGVVGLVQIVRGDQALLEAHLRHSKSKVLSMRMIGDQILSISPSLEC